MLLGRETLVGLDFFQLHVRRIAFARNGLFGANHSLPGWYPHELLGAPFAANLQSFPWIPTRLILLFLDPEVIFGAGVVIAALLAALFTYLYCRRAGISQIGAAAAGWTFACAGYFSTRLMAGHLPLLEAYPSLPLLFWLIERAFSAERTGFARRDLVMLAFASACTVLAGHPQVPSYSIAAAVLYILFRGRGWQRIRVISSMALGIGTTFFAWWPMLLLAGRSTRVLHLAEPSNDIVMPYHRLLALLDPGIDGLPEIIAISEKNQFRGFPNDAYFWDTASYVGILPLLVIVMLAFLALSKRKLPVWPGSFLTAMGLGALVLALPLAEPLHHLIPGTLLRSPARLLYLSTFSASVAMGFGVSAFMNSGVLKLPLRRVVVTGWLLLHALDLGVFSLQFVKTIDRTGNEAPPFAQILDREVGDGRVAIEHALALPYDDRYDDVGVFDSILLARPYRAVMGLTGSPQGFNEQRLDGSEFSLAALQYTGVRFVVTSTERTDLPVAAESEDAYLYRVPGPAPRAAFFAGGRIDFVSPEKVLDAFVAHPNSDRLLLPSDARRYLPQASADSEAGAVRYSRPSSDEIVLEKTGGEAGFAEVLESFDPGWTAEVDGARAPVVAANGFTLAVPVATGRHHIRIHYDTPGRIAGWILTFVSAGLLAGLTLRFGSAVESEGPL